MWGQKTPAKSVHDGDITPAYRPVIVLRRAQSIADAIPTARRGTPIVRALHEVLVISAGSAH
ncbi:hypothetical protein DMB66_57870 [Actinoplanes sp. ATCC 53533]|uniref:hypothetical protein n=1 Tax=Actinoplanes sp. ATCC 53533 TaxID=1288362 RepID=UPI000F7A6FE3|nr:hypothetical protein [Actinoplanes sp. ATCC 53533]RSM39783.1 hypothetical protein DMB66_57870 [Actinoplanes sp. ATCC 53533]